MLRRPPSRQIFRHAPIGSEAAYLIHQITAYRQLEFRVFGQAYPDRIADAFAEDANTRVVAVDAIPDDWQGLDIGPATREAFAALVAEAGTVFWNGPMGVFEMAAFAEGTKAVATAIADSSAFSVVGGGDSAAAVRQLGIDEAGFTHISTGGGASLEYLEGKELPGLTVLEST